LTLLPRTLFWRAFAAQMLLIVVSFTLVIIVLSRDQARTSAVNMAAIWVPALREALDRPDPSAAELTIRVVRDVTLLQRAPPPGAHDPWGSPRFDALRTALAQQGVPVQRIVVSGVTDNSVTWLQVQSGPPARWIGVVSNLEGEDIPGRMIGLSLAGLALAALSAAALSRMVARPAQQLAHAVEAFGQGQPLPQVPSHAPDEIQSLVRTVAHTFEQRRELDDQRSLMLAGLSHDIRSPLARIRLAAELLPAAGPDTCDLKQRIEHNVTLVDRLVGSFADFVRAEQAPLDPQVDIGHLARQAAQSFGLPANSVTVHGQPLVAGNADLLRRALDNLLDNALRYGAAPVTISVTPQAREVQLAVCNAGEPVDEADLARLRQPFERGERHRATPGSGLGLAIVERVARLHGGRFELTATANPPGTRACLVLPHSEAANRC
jgi:two-component system, OmpR family, osmolarity sensor histidine kinase EnvZ